MARNGESETMIAACEKAAGAAPYLYRRPFGWFLLFPACHSSSRTLLQLYRYLKEGDRQGQAFAHQRGPSLGAPLRKHSSNHRTSAGGRLSRMDTKGYSCLERVLPNCSEGEHRLSPRCVDPERRHIVRGVDLEGRRSLIGCTHGPLR
jgi:hypothetical protein